jgi:hypothetical protein
LKELTELGFFLKEKLSGCPGVEDIVAYSSGQRGLFEVPDFDFVWSKIVRGVVFKHDLYFLAYQYAPI